MKRIIYLLLIVLSPLMTTANNIQITNVTIINNGPGNIQVEFDLSWDNSWRVNTGPNNYDGAWVFFKYKQAGGTWRHITMTGSNNSIPVGFDVYQNSEFQKTGAVIYRETNGIGNVSISNIRLGVVNTLPYDIDVKTFAIEMVYIPPPSTRPFFGDGDGDTESDFALHYTDNTATTGSVIPMRADANALDDGELEVDGMYIYSNDTIQTTVPLGDLDPFPTMKAVWCMKYEISQAAYRDFLNTLDLVQQTTRTANPPTNVTGTGAMFVAGSNRTFIEIATPSTGGAPAVYGCDADADNIYNEANDGEWVACNFINWSDIAAFLDWSGLAPMSEIQFERICRGNSSAGPNPAILGEYAWGNATIFNSAYTLGSSATASEIASNASVSLGNAAYNVTSILGPLRNGIFATGISTRITSGATYYGVMEMTGNLAEMCIHIGSVAGRSCRYVPNGNGTISVNGNAQLSVGGAGFWPGMEGNGALANVNTCSGTCEVTGSAGIRLRGGSISEDAAELTMANRGQAFVPTARAQNRGGRGILYLR